MLFLVILFLDGGWVFCVLKDKGCYLLFKIVDLAVVDHFFLELRGPKMGNSTFHQQLCHQELYPE